MQDPEHMRARCAKCHADRDQPCVTISGDIAEKVHYGRPAWSDLVNDGYGFKTNIRHFRAHPYPTLFPGTDICADCGDTYRQPGLLQRCKPRHQEGTTHGRNR